MHAPAAFHADRIAWRAVIYLNLVRSVRRPVHLFALSVPLLIPLPIEFWTPSPRTLKMMTMTSPIAQLGQNIAVVRVLKLSITNTTDGHSTLSRSSKNASYECFLHLMTKTNRHVCLLRGLTGATELPHLAVKGQSQRTGVQALSSPSLLVNPPFPFPPYHLCHPPEHRAAVLPNRSTPKSAFTIGLTGRKRFLLEIESKAQKVHIQTRLRGGGTIPQTLFTYSMHVPNQC